jgi:HEAT repeat protein
VAFTAALAACGRSSRPPREVEQDSSARADVSVTHSVDAGGTYVPPELAEDAMKRSDPEVATAIASLGEEHAQEWSVAMKWLIDHPARSREAVVALVETMGVGMDVARAITVLGEIGDPADVPLLVRGLTEADEVGKADFGHALALHDAQEALEALLAAAESDDTKTVEAAVSALGERRDEKARPVLEKRLDHGADSVRYRAVLALIDLGPRPSRDALRRRGKVEKVGDVKDAIRRALAR